MKLQKPWENYVGSCAHQGGFNVIYFERRLRHFFATSVLRWKHPQGVSRRIRPGVDRKKLAHPSLWTNRVFWRRKCLSYFWQHRLHVVHRMLFSVNGSLDMWSCVYYVSCVFQSANDCHAWLTVSGLYCSRKTLQLLREGVELRCHRFTVFNCV